MFQEITLIRLLAVRSASQSAWRCWAYEEDGTVCGRPAVAVDAERGYTVCARHMRRRQSERGNEPGKTTTPSAQ